MSLLAPAGNESPLLWLSFALPVVVLLALDLGSFLRSSREPTLTESLAWTGAWAALAAMFGIVVSSTLGPVAGLSFFTAYVVEQALSVDNLFVFLVVFRELDVPRQGQRRALAWGILAALVLRAAMLAAGGAFVARFHLVGALLGLLLVAMGARAAWKLAAQRTSEDEDDAPRSTAAGSFVARWLPVHDRFEEDRFTVRVAGRRLATPLLVAVVAILAADVVFAVDSIPAVLGVTSRPILVITSNVLAVLGLRAMFFLVRDLLARLRYLPHGLAAVLVVVGSKMLAGGWGVVDVPTWLSLATILSILAVAVIASVRSPSPHKTSLEER
jgi:tellurite resistance protein TerC